MKNKRLKNYLKFGILLFGIIIINYSCQKDVDASIDEELQNTSSLFSKINFETFKYKVEGRDLSDTDIIRLISNETVAIAQIQYSTESEKFVKSIDSSNVLEAEKDGVTSFTFKTQTLDMSKTTNYILAYDENNTVKEFYLTYEEDGSSRVIDPETGGEVTTEGSYWCPISNTVWVCECHDHVLGTCNGVCGEGFRQITTITYEYCGPGLGEGSGGAGNGDGGDGEGNGGSGTGDGDGNDLPIDGLVITKPEKLEPPKPDCDELAKNEENALFNQYIQELEDNTANGENEKGFNILYLPPTATEPEEETLVIPAPNPNGMTEGTPTNVSLPNNFNRKAFAHNHIPTVPESLKIFSPGDVGVLGEILNIQQNNPNSPLEVEQLAIYAVTGDTITNQQFTFALKIENSNSKLINFAQKYPRFFKDENNNIVENPNWDKRLYRKVNNNYRKKINPKFTKNKQIKGFLNFIKKQNLGATFYEKNPTTDAWEKVYLDDNGVVKREPCS